MSYQLSWLRKQNVIGLWLWVALGLSACKLDTQGGTAVMVPTDSGPAISSALPDAATTGTSTTPVMTGRADASTPNTGSMSSGEMSMEGLTPPPPPKKVDGDACAADTDCSSGHCLHDICCAGGDCCRMPSDCPKMIVDGLQVACNDPSTCQGKRGAVSCENFLCVATGDIPDDSACTSQIVKDCTPYKAVTCNGMMDQQEPPCPTKCASDSDCVEAAHCDTSTNTCEMDEDDGSQCAEDHDCRSDHCSNRVCCKSGDCCTDANICFLYGSLPMCVDLNSCMGSQKVATCKAFQCASEERPNMQICNGMTVQRCGLYLDARCENGVREPCATSCRVDSQCKPEAYCKQTAQGGTCEPKQRDGEACTSTAQCRNACNHGFCCGDTNPDTYCCGSDDNCSMLNKSGCVADTNSCDGMVTTGVCNPEKRCVPQNKPDPNSCSGRSIECGAGYQHPASCPLGCGCSNTAADCSTGYTCSVPSGATRGTCQRDTSMGGAGAGGMSGMP